MPIWGRTFSTSPSLLQGELHFLPKPLFNSLYDPFGSPCRGQKPQKEGCNRPTGAICSKTYPSFLTVKEGSTPHLGLLPSGKKRETALLGAQNRYALGVADHQRSAPGFAGWDRMEKVCYSNAFCFDNSFNEATNQKCHYAYRCRLKVEYLTVYFIILQDSSLIHPNH